MYTVKPTTRFSKDLKRIEKRGYKIDLLTETIAETYPGIKFF
jgi:mRNA interferase YafQ